MINHRILAMSLIATAVVAAAQNHLTYSGSFPSPIKDYKEGRATYSYITAPDGTRVYDGEFEYQDDETYLKGNYVNDIQNGKWTLIYKQDGTRHIEADFVDGRYDGEVNGAYVNGDKKVEFRYNFEDGLLNGPFYTTGTPFPLGSYSHGYPSGVWAAMVDGQDHQAHEVTFQANGRDDSYDVSYIDSRTGEKIKTKVYISENIFDGGYYSLKGMLSKLANRKSQGLVDPAEYARNIANELGSVVYSDEEIEIVEVKKLQFSGEESASTSNSSRSSANDNAVYRAVDDMPFFPGGEGALMAYISSHIRYPESAQENGVQGRVVVQFVVTKTGSIGEVKVVRSKDPDLDREAIRVVKTLPKFVPGKMNGEPVSTWYTLPITFKLQ